MDILKKIFAKVFGENKENNNTETNEKNQELYKEKLGSDISLTEASKLIEDYYSKGISKYLEKLNSIYKNIQGSVEEIRKGLYLLEKAEPSDQVDPQILKVAISNKKDFIKKMDSLCNNLSKPLGNKYQDVMDYFDLVSTSINEVNNKTLKEFSVISEIYKYESKFIYNSFKDSYNLVKEMSRDIIQMKSEIRPLVNALEEINLLSDELSEINSHKKELSEFDSKIEKLNNLITENRKKLEDMEKTKEWVEINLHINRRAQVESEIKEARSQLKQNFFKLENLIKKLVHIVKKGVFKTDMEESDLKFLNDLLENPEECLIDLNDTSKIEKILISLRKALSEGKIKTKNPEKEISEIDYLIYNKIFQNLLDNYKILSQEREELENIISEEGVLKNKNIIERRIDQMKSEISLIEEEKKILQKHIESLERSAREKIENIENILRSSFNKNFKIKF